MTLEKQQIANRSSKALIVVGFVAMAISFLAYWNNSSLAITPAAMPALQRLAVATYLVLPLSFGAIGVGLYRIYQIKASVSDDSITSVVANALNSKRAKQIFLAGFIGYGLFFAFTSGMILYKPDLKATDFGFPAPPYAELSPCCNYPGYMPMILAYFTENIGIQIIPLNLVLLVSVSFLVGLNFVLSSKAFSLSRSRKGTQLSTIGAATGLFVGCPTCAGTAFFLITGLWGTASALSTSIFLTTYQVQLQSIFIAISIPILVLTILVMAKNIRKSQSGSCSLEKSNQP